MLQGRVRTAEEHYCAALVFQHGESEDDFRLAYSLATLAATLDPSREEARYMTAATWDRLLMTLNRPQWYGTQYVRRPEGGWALYPVDESAVTDDQRHALGAPSLTEARAKLDAMNRR